MNKIVVQNIHKRFKMGLRKRQGVLAKIVSLISGREQKKEVAVLNNISFKINSGEIVGLIGKNGSGKSTILRIIAGIYAPDKGEVISNGKIVSMINLGVALKERLTMRENIFLVGSLFGMNQKEIRNNFDNIVNFSELNKFIDTKIYQFSSGMIQRLAFSIVVYSNPDILLLDEVFEVGDEDFRKKSTEKLKDFVTKNKSIIFVTHDLEMIKKQCHRVIWLENGIIKMEGTPDSIIKEYVK